MEKQDIDIWSRKFKTIVWNKGQLRNRNANISTLTRYDKNDSHKQAILNAIKYRDEAKKEFVDSCEGFEYDYIMESLRKAKNIYSKCMRKNDFTELNNFNPFNNGKRI